MNRLPFNSTAAQHINPYTRQCGNTMIHSQQQQMPFNQSAMPIQLQPQMQSPYPMRNMYQMQNLYQTQNPYETQALFQIQPPFWLQMPYQVQSRYPVHYLPQYQIQNSLYLQQNQHFGTFNHNLQPQLHSLHNQPAQNNLQWQAQQYPLGSNVQNVQPSHSSHSENTLFGQVQQTPLRTAHRYQANLVTPPTPIQLGLTNHSNDLPKAAEELAPVEGSTRDTAIVLEGDDEHEEVAAVLPVPSSPSPPAPKKPEHSFYSEMFAEVDSMGRKKLDENGKPIRRSIESMARRPGRMMPQLAPPAPKGSARKRAEQIALEEAVLVKSETSHGQEEKSSLLKRKSTEADLDSDLAPRKKRAGIDSERSLVSETASIPEASPAPQLIDDCDDSLFGDLDIDQAPHVADVAPFHASRTPEPLIMAADDPGDIENVHVPDLPKRPKIGGRHRRRAKPKPPKTTSRAAPKSVREVTARAVTPVEPAEDIKAYNAQLEFELEAELAEDERPRSPTPTSDEDEDENYCGNLKYKNR